MCGIFGGSALKGHKLNSFKLKMLGVYNTERGTHSCGYYYNGNIEKYSGVNADFKDLIGSKEFNGDFLCGDLNCETFIGHTRASSVYNKNGYYPVADAHPFEVNNRYVQAHNGKIENINELINKYNVGKWFNVDSNGLAHIIEKIGFEVLNEYEGYATLAMTFKEDPSSLYLYAGASYYSDSNRKQMYYERPLYILYAEEGMYFSSMENSLKAIANKNEKIFHVPCNEVIQIKDGNLTDFKYEVNRDERNKPKQVSKVESIVKSSIKDLIINESEPSEMHNKNIIYYRNSRYRDPSGKLLHGKYYITNDGILALGNNYDKIQESSVFFFVRGVMIKDEDNYNKAIEIKNIVNINTALVLSRYSIYPIYNLIDEAHHVSEAYKTGWFFNFESCQNYIFNPLFSCRTYLIDNTKTKSINLIN